jgi:hypothetical protein
MRAERPSGRWRTIRPWIEDYAGAYFAERGLVSLRELWRKQARYIEAPEQLRLALG